MNPSPKQSQAILVSAEDVTLCREQVAALVAAHLCADTDTAEACGRCRSCLWLRGEGHPDLIELDGEEKSISVDSIREACTFLQLSATNGHGRVLVLLSADNMTLQAANALLKTLEEPAPDCLLILSTRQPSLLLPTIRSRLVQVEVSAHTSAGEGVESLSPLESRYCDGRSALPADLDVETAYGTVLTNLLSESAWSLAAQRLTELTWPVVSRMTLQLIEDAVRLHNTGDAGVWAGSVLGAEFERFAGALPAYAWVQLWSELIDRERTTQAGVKSHEFSAVYELIYQARRWQAAKTVA